MLFLQPLKTFFPIFVVHLHSEIKYNPMKRMILALICAAMVMPMNAKCANKKSDLLAWVNSDRQIVFFFAEKGGFEPPVPLRVRQFSKLLVSATHPSLLCRKWLALPPFRHRNATLVSRRFGSSFQKRLQKYCLFLTYTNFWQIKIAKSVFFCSNGEKAVLLQLYLWIRIPK